MVDATEQEIERPTKGQKPYYSGKKKRVHDFKVFKTEPPLPTHSTVYVDSGYQGIDECHLYSEFPYKASKKKPLPLEEKKCNRGLSRVRVGIENVVGDIKIKIFYERYRNKRKRCAIKFKIIAGIINLKNGFWFAQPLWEKGRS